MIQQKNWFVFDFVQMHCIHLCAVPLRNKIPGTPFLTSVPLVKIDSGTRISNLSPGSPTSRLM